MASPVKAERTVSGTKGLPGLRESRSTSFVVFDDPNYEIIQCPYSSVEWQLVLFG